MALCHQLMIQLFLPLENRGHSHSTLEKMAGDDILEEEKKGGEEEKKLNKTFVLGTRSYVLRRENLNF